MNYAQLRRQLRQLVGDLKDLGTNPQLSSICQKIGLPIPDEGGSKRDRLHSSFDQVSDQELPKVAALLLEHYGPVAVVRNQVQDLIWADSETPTIEKNVRRAIANAFDTRCEGDLYANATNFSALLKSLFVITEVSPDLTTSLRDDIDLLKLREYEVFHFGGLELQQDDDSQALVKDFFLRLFKRHGITAASVLI